MATAQKKQPPYQAKVTLQKLNEELLKQAHDKQLQIMELLGIKSRKTVYDIINGQRVCSPAEKEVIAKVYGKRVWQINWKD